MAAPEVLSFREFRAGLAGVARAEAALSASRLTGLERRRLPGRDDLARPQACHRCILGDVYGWARAAAHRVHREGTGVLPAAAPGVLRRGRVRPASRSRPAAGPGPRPVHHRPGRVLADVKPCIRSARATAAPGGRSSPSSPTTPGITSPGCAWTLTAIWPPAPPPATATWPRCGKCPAS